MKIMKKNKSLWFWLIILLWFSLIWQSFAFDVNSLKSVTNNSILTSSEYNSYLYYKEYDTNILNSNIKDNLEKIKKLKFNLEKIKKEYDKSCSKWFQTIALKVWKLKKWNYKCEKLNNLISSYKKDVNLYKDKLEKIQNWLNVIKKWWLIQDKNLLWKYFNNLTILVEKKVKKRHFFFFSSS